MSRPLRFALGAFLALASFLAGTAVLCPLVPPAEGGKLYAKIEYFEATRDTYNAVFLGSSRLLRGLDTRLVDEAMTRAGVPMRSFNFGVAGTWAFEQDHLLHELLAMEPRHLRWIFYGGRPVGAASTPQHGFDNEPDLRSARGIQWHTPRQTRLVLGAIRRMDAPLSERLELAGTHLELLARRATALGRGPAAFRRRFETRPERATREADLLLMHETLGNHGLDEHTDREPSEVMDELRRDPRPYERRVARIPELNAAEVDLDEIHVEVYAEQLAAARSRGIELVYFTAPGFEGTPERLRLHEAGVIPTLFHFNDPERYPELFAIEHRFDRGHLNRAGTELWSARFAERLLEHMDGGERDP